MRRRRALVALVAGVAVVAAGCSGVPSSSAPQVVRSVGPAEQPRASIPPPPKDAAPATIVSGFLKANVSTVDDKHQAAKQYLTTAARSRWSDSSVTVVDSYSVSPSASKSNVLTVNAVKVGSLAPNGIYTPAQQGNGTGPENLTLSYGMRQVAGQWRIDRPAQGLVVPASDFGSSLASPYQLHPLYFLDLSGKRLVADPRYSSLSSPSASQALATWLLTQLIAGPRPELATAVLSLPEQINPKSTSVTVTGGLTTVEVPGSRSLDAQTLRRLAAEFAYTFEQDYRPSPVQITDGGRLVPVPGVGSSFESTDFGTFFAPPDGTLVAPPLVYLSASPNSTDTAGLVTQQNRQLMPGPLGHHDYGLSSIVLAKYGSKSDYRAAGVSGPPRSSRLLLGTVTSGLQDSGLKPGRLTRPTWAPAKAEVWVGDGTKLIRIPVGQRPSVVAMNLPAGKITGIRAVGFSPDGVRIALVIAASDGSSEAYVGTVERSGANPRVDNLVPITPSDVKVTDVSWNDGTGLYVIGTGPGGYSVWSVLSDGSGWLDRHAGNLPYPPDSITSANGGVPWVSAHGALYTQSSNVWVSPFQPAFVAALGTSPSYLE